MRLVRCSSRARSAACKTLAGSSCSLAKAWRAARSLRFSSGLFFRTTCNEALSPGNSRSGFFNEHIAETGGLKDSIDLRGRARGLKDKLLMLHMPPVLQEHAKASRTDKS